MVSATKADKVTSRPSAVKQVKRLVYLLSTAPAPAPKAVGNKPSYLRYIEYV